MRESRDDPRDADRSRVERALAPFFHDSGLWPVTAVLVAHLVLAIAVLLLDVVRTPGAFSGTALAAIAAGSLAALADAIRRRRLGPLAATVLASWALGALAAWAASHWRLY